MKNVTSDGSMPASRNVLTVTSMSLRLLRHITTISTSPSSPRRFAPITSCSVRRSPSDAAGNPTLITCTPMSASARAISSFCGGV